jgi:raffinose/stachyose/melibiose transport system substrate-binding protein
LKIIQAHKGEGEMNKKISLYPLVSLLLLASLLLSACGTPAPTAAPAATAVPATVAPAATAVPATAAPVATGPICGTDPVVMKVVFETGWDMPTQLTEEFTKQFPNVTWDITMEQFANLITRPT